MLHEAEPPARSTPLPQLEIAMPFDRPTLRMIAGLCTPALCCAAMVLGSAAITHANPIALHDAPDAAAMLDGAMQDARRSRAVVVDLEELDSALQNGSDPVSLTIFEDVRVDLRIDRVSYYSRSMSAYTGRLGDGQDAAAWYSLVRNGDALIGHFWTGDGRVFKIRPLDDRSGLHVALELDSDGFEPCLTCEAEHGSLSHQLPEPTVVQGARGCEDDGSVIDVLVVYTPSARNGAGGTSAIQGLAVSAIEVTNQAYINSGVQTTVRLAHLAEVNYNETGSFSQDLSNLRTGVVPGVLALREEFDADLVAMLNDSSGACGIAYLMQSLDPGFESLGFSVTDYACAVGNLTFPHELGHNMGCQHDVNNAGSNPIFPYSFGWRWTTTGGQLRRSVMAYSPGARVPHFSNPDVSNGGTPTGVVSAADNARTINNTAYIVSNFRVSDCTQGPDDCGWSALGSGIDGTVLAATAHDDGSGQALYVAGNFNQAGGQDISRVARWDGAAWSPVGGGINGTVHALLSIDSGPLTGLYASGFFSSAGSTGVANIARWDGETWSALGQGLNNRAYALATFDDGTGPSLYAAGIFTNSGGEPLSRIARWDGQSWQALGTGLNGIVNTLEVFDDGSGPALYAGGLISLAGSQPVQQVARWDGQAWSPLGAGGPDNMVNDLAVFDDGNGAALYAAGRFENAGDQPAPGIARWDGIAWSAVGDGLATEIFALLPFEDADGPALFAAGSFVATLDSLPAIGIARWDGQAWRRMGLGVGGAGGRTLASAQLGLGPAMFVGGTFTSAGSQQAASIARWACRSVICPQDLDADGEVSLADLNLVLASFGQQTEEGDSNGDGVVDLADLNAVLSGFGRTCD
jgi:hypothetical protein